MKIRLRFTYILYILLLFPLAASAQQALVRGTITCENDSEVIPYAYVTLRNTTYSAVSDKRGSFTLRAPEGSYTLVATALGYEDHEQPVELRNGSPVMLDLVMQQGTIGIENVEVKGKSLVQQVNESSFNVVAIDAAALHNTTLDLAHALDRVSGIKIRESGGVGSGASISLNGFTGRHVKVFMDGVPMEGSGSSFDINNIPVSLAERIEVYKGVVPVELGADALGGAINIVTRKTANTYLDVSYSFGSFNTHRSNISFGHVTRKGFLVQLNAYQNYSDNSYKVKTEYLQLYGDGSGSSEEGEETGKEFWSTDQKWFKRFHDMYRNEAVVAKIGVTDKKWATRFLVGATLSREVDEIQNANLMKIAYGGRVRKSKGATPGFNYEKRDLIAKNLDLSLSGNYSITQSSNIDTMARRYSWTGEYVDTDKKGEGTTYSTSINNNNNFYITANLKYRIAGKHFISLNNVFSSFWRKATDAAANVENSNAATFMKRTSNKNVLGLSYKYVPTERMNLTAFGKYYNVKTTGPVNTSTTSTAAYELQSRDFSTYGYGLAATYLITRSVQAKLSLEQAYRLPTDRELFGDAVLETGDVTLKAENSRNINLNMSYNGELTNGHFIYAEAGLIYRDTRDYIRRRVGGVDDGGVASYENHGKVRNMGLDFETRYFWKEKLSLGGNFTYQNLRNREPLTSNNTPSISYKDRMPNVPYMFGTFDAAYNFRNLICRGSVLTIAYNLNYVHDFYRNWKYAGATALIPGHTSHDASVTYAFKEARYNVSFEVNNFTDEIIYDNYSLQKPGRSFNVKLRYFFFKAKETRDKTGPSRHGNGRRHGGRGHGRPARTLSE